MGYVEHLLKGKLASHNEIRASANARGYTDIVETHLKVISEIEYVLELLKDNETYQKY